MSLSTDAEHSKFSMRMKGWRSLSADATGWFWWTCRVESLPDCSPKGPFATSYLAYRDASMMLEA